MERLRAGQPAVVLDPPPPGASQLSGYACNVDTSKIKVVVYALTNQWYVQPYAAWPFTNIASDGSWTTGTHPWEALVVLLVDPANYAPPATEITNPALDPNVLAWTNYPAAPISVSFSGYTWGIKVTGNAPGDQFDPGPNFWSSDPSVVSVAADGLHLNITAINGHWQSGEVYLTQALGYGTYTVQIDSRLDQLDQHTVAAPLFLYAAPGQELDNEYSGMGGLIPAPNNAQLVVQPYTVPGNMVRYLQPPTAQFTSQMEWFPDHVTFRTWNGWSTVPDPNDIISEWTYTGAYIPPPGNERVRINLWLLNGAAPTSGVGDSMIIRSFTYQPSTTSSVSASCAPTTIEAGQTSQCTATVQGTGNYNAAVTWRASAGTISSSGVYTAPTVTSATQVTITATSVQDTSKSGTTTITVNPVPPTITSVSANCLPSTIQSGQTSQCTATVQGTGNFSSSVTWSASTGTISASGLYAAPTVTTATQVTITATSVQDTTKYGSTTITVNRVPPTFVQIPDITLDGLGRKITPLDLSAYVQGGEPPFTFAVVTQTLSDSVVCSVSGKQLVSDYAYHAGTNTVTVAVTDANQESARTAVNINVTIPTVVYQLSTVQIIEFRIIY